MSSSVAQLLEHSSRETPEGNADPKMLLYRTGHVQTPDIANVVLRISDLETLAKHMDYRLDDYLKEDVKGYDYAIASLSSVGGKMLNYLTTTTQSYNIREVGQPASKISMKDLMEPVDNSQQYMSQMPGGGGK